MSYQAIAATVRITPHPKADRLEIAVVANHRVVVGKGDYQNGDLVLFFPEGGQLSHAVCHENNLYREGKGINKNPEIVGYISDRRRIRSMKLRGIESNGLVLGFQAFAFTGADLGAIKEGQLVNELNGQQICCKYVTPATQRAISKAKRAALKRPKDPSMFKQHYQTPKLRYSIDRIPDGARITITRKLHGTSGRTGYCRVGTERALPFWQSVLNRLGASYTPKVDYAYKYISGSRRVTFHNIEDTSDSYRITAHQLIEGKLKKGETAYYEILHTDPTGTALFTHAIPEAKDKASKAMRKRYGSTMNYTYGVLDTDIYLYRMTMTNEDGVSMDYSPSQLARRANEMAIQVVPFVGEYTHINGQIINTLTGEADILSDKCARLSQGASALDSRHITEGIVVRVEHPDMEQVFKYKGFDFCTLEGIRKNSDTYVDPEEAA